MNIFFVCGAPKSGTTWVQRILDAHPRICCSGEGHFIERFSAPMSRVVNVYNRQMNLEAEQIFEGGPVYGPVDQAEFDAVIRAFAVGRMASRAGPQVRWLGDKTSRYTYQLGQLHRIFPEARFVHIVRDPRDMAVSRLGHANRIGVPSAFTPGSERHEIEVRSTVTSWLEAVSAVDAFRAEHPALVHELAYRDLHLDAPGAIKAMLDFLGAPSDPGLLDAMVRSAALDTLTGAKLGEEGAGSYFRRGLSEDRKPRLPAQTERIIRESCGGLMRRKGFAA